MNTDPPVGINYPPDPRRFFLGIDRTNKDNVRTQLDYLRKEIDKILPDLKPGEVLHLRFRNLIDAQNLFGDRLTVIGEILK
jgi:hypothetical protein